MLDDPHQWLENVEGEDALAWVRSENTRTKDAFLADSHFETLRRRLLAVLDSDDRIPYVSQVGPFVTNFWRDADHPRGVWRRTTLEDYATGSPKWETLLDLDRLAEEEDENWVYSGSLTLRPSFDRALVTLSRGGADAVVVREFDLSTLQFVSDGFFIPEAKTRLDWFDRDHVMVGTDFGPGSMTESGYPRTVRLWRRGTPLAEATLLQECRPEDVATGAWRQVRAQGDRHFAYVRRTFFSELIWLVSQDGLVALEKPESASFEVHEDWALLTLREDFTTGGRTFAQGSLLVADFEAFREGRAVWEPLFEPTPTTSLRGLATPRGHLVINTLEDVKNRLFVCTPSDAGWTRRPLLDDAEGATFDAIDVAAVDAAESTALWVYRSGFTTPATFGHLDLATGTHRTLRKLPALYDATGVEVSQHFATSADGTRIPYFQIGKATETVGPRPTVLFGYGGFEVSLMPAYNPVSGLAWIERGGILVVANLRGGGEYGPRWHQAALKENRPRAYEDFEAVARDLVARDVTVPSKLGIRGGSNGGLLMGNMYVRAPELWGAVVCQVPLLDMKRYTKLLAGASWEGEYGDPDDPEQWSFIEGFSPYHQLRADGRTYPPLLLTTSTRDDRVHPGHARKFKAALDALGRGDVWYYENIEGGHGGAANNEQTAYLNALAHTFLWRMLDTP